jgi:DsbC/DsbD-like thiol-disulfide interchange protein
MKKLFWSNMLALLTLWAVAPAAQAQTGGWVSADYAQVRLIGDGMDAGLDIRLAPGWHAYWRMPGDGGLAPVMDWSDSVNLKDVTVQWPVPRRFSDAGLQSFGYTGAYILPLTVTPEKSGKPVDLKLALNLMVCEKICVPQTFDVALRLPVTDSREGPRLAAARKLIPPTGNTETLKLENVVIGPAAVVARVYAPHGFDQMDVFVEAGDLYITAVPEIMPDENEAHYAMIKIPAPEGVENLFNEISGKSVTLTVTDGRRAIERRFDF